MAIVATLAGIVATQVSGSGETSRDVQTQQDASTVITAVGDNFSDRQGAEFLRPRTVEVLDEPGIRQETSSLWPEVYINSAYPTVFSAERNTVAAVSFFSESGVPSVLSVRGLLENYNAIDFAALLEGGYLQQAPDGVDVITDGLDSYLWLLKVDTVAGGGGTVSSREVEVFKLTTIQGVEGTDFKVLAYQRIFGEEIDNDLPAGFPQRLITFENTPLNITLDGIDGDGDDGDDDDGGDLTFTVVVDPTNGTLTGTPPDLTYRNAEEAKGRLRGR